MSYLYFAPVLSGTIPDPVGNPLTGDLTWTAATTASYGLLLHFDGANGQTTTIDSSLNANVISEGGGAALSTSSPKFGTAAGNFVNANGSGWYTPLTPGGPLDLHQTAFTVQCWVKTTRVGQGVLWADRASIGTYSWLRGYANGATAYLQFIFNTFTAAVPGPYSAALNDGNWHHLVMSAGPPNAGVAIDGVWGTINDAYVFDNAPATSFNADFEIGFDGYSAIQTTGFVGQMDEFAVSNQVVYPIGVNFTPPIAPFGTVATDYEVYRADIGNLANTSTLGYNDTVPSYGSYTYTVQAVGGDPTTLLLMHMDGSFADSSVNTWPVNSSGTGSFSSSTYKFTESFAIPDYNPFSTAPPAYVPFAALSPLDIFATSAWTVEFFVYPVYSGDPGAFILNYNGSPDNGYNPGTSLLWIVQANSDGSANISANNNGAFSGAGSITATVAGLVNTWVHVAVVNNGSTTSLFINGVLQTGAGTSSPSWNAANYSGAFVSAPHRAPAVVIGGFGGYNGNRQACYLDELRISATAVYTANFTPPTAPFSVNNIQLSPLSNPVTLIYGGLSSLYGKFVGAAAYKPNLLIDAKGLKPRIWMPKENVTVKT